ncbi:hypothetical protein AB0N05_27560 [Nocardia sp. NPDC051030]|uniref:hypothetical protein n=1 Tax=Nocardia sp. NPDC051030 TaxID=3155162 RepID=UPI00342EDC9B
MVDDVEKRWNDPPTFRLAVKYVVGVLVLTAIAAALVMVWTASRQQCLNDTMMCDTAAKLVVGLVPGGILLLGGLGAFVLAFRYWKSGRVWTIWQGAGWFLFTLMVVWLSFAGGA